MTESTTDQDGPALTDAVATPSMIEAGADELSTKKFGEPLSEIVQDVFYAMVAASQLNSKAS